MDTIELETLDTHLKNLEQLWNLATTHDQATTDLYFIDEATVQRAEDGITIKVSDENIGAELAALPSGAVSLTVNGRGFEFTAIREANQEPRFTLATNAGQSTTDIIQYMQNGELSTEVILSPGRDGVREQFLLTPENHVFQTSLNGMDPVSMGEYTTRFDEGAPLTDKWELAPLYSALTAGATDLFEATSQRQQKQATVEIYGLPNCQACRMTEKALAKAGVAFEVRDLQDHPEIAQQAKDLGFTSAPVVKAGDEIYAGYNPGRIKDIINAHGPVNPHSSERGTQPGVAPLPNNQHRGQRR